MIRPGIARSRVGFEVAWGEDWPPHPDHPHEIPGARDGTVVIFPRDEFPLDHPLVKSHPDYFDRGRR